MSNRGQTGTFAQTSLLIRKSHATPAQLPSSTAIAKQEKLEKIRCTGDKAARAVMRTVERDQEGEEVDFRDHRRELPQIDLVPLRLIHSSFSNSHQHW